MATAGLDIHPRALAQFVAVAEHRHLGRAAASMQISQRSLGKTLSQLEREAGEPLLHPGARSVMLTPAGEVFVESARRVLEAMDRLAAVATANLATVRVAHVADTNTLTTVLDDLARDHPDVVVEECVASGVEQISMVAGHQLDMALCGVTRHLPDGLHAVPIREDPLVVICPANHSGDHFVDLHEEPLVVPVYGDHWPQFDDFVNALAADHGLELEPIPVPGGTARELDALLRRSTGRRVLMLQSTAFRTNRPSHRPAGLRPHFSWQLVWRQGPVSHELKTLIDTTRLVSAANGWLDASTPAHE